MVSDPIVVHKYAVVDLAGFGLERKCYEISKATLGQRRLVRDDAVVGIKTYFRVSLKRKGDNVRQRRPHHPCTCAFRKEEPDVRSFPRTRPLQRNGKFQFAHLSHHGQGIAPPRRFVEINDGECDRFVLRHRVRPHLEGLLHAVLSAQMPPDDFIRNRKHIPVGALRTLHAPQQTADSTHPLVLATGRISLLAGLGIVKTPSKNITPTAKQRTEQFHLFVI